MSADRITLDGTVTSDEPRWVAACTSHRSRAIGLALCLLFGCSGGSTGAGDPSGDGAPATATSSDAEQPAADPRWQYLPTLRKFVTEGVTVRPFLEVTGGRTGELWILTVSHGGGEPRVELWDFHTPEGEQVVTLREGPLPILRVDPEDEHQARLDDLRRSFASPGSKRTRLAGLPTGGDDPESQARDLLQQLVAAAKTFRDASAPAEAQADALLALVQGLDDRIVLERDELGATIDLLVSLGEPTKVDAGRKIVRITSPAGDHELELELIAKGEGWVLMSAQRPE